MLLGRSKLVCTHLLTQTSTWGAALFTPKNFARPRYTHSGGASGRSEWEALPGMCLVGPSTAARRRCLGLWSGLRLGGSPRNRCLLQRHRAFPWSAVQRSASYRSLRKGVCRTLGPRPGKLATDALQVLSLRGKPSRSSPTSHPLNLTNKQKTHTKVVLQAPYGAKGYPETYKVYIYVK